MPNYRLSKYVCLKKNPFGSSVKNDLVNKPCPINIYDYNSVQFQASKN